MASKDFEPTILGFLCNWCSYAGADFAGLSRVQQPANQRVIRVMCSARVDPVIVLEALIRGIDGVMVLGCHLGDCHYITGNYQTERRMKTTKKMLNRIGVDPRRLLLDWVSAAEGERYATLIKEFVEEIKDLGPLGSETKLEAEELKLRLVTAKRVLAQEDVRWLMGKERELVEDKNVFGQKVPQEEFDEVMLEAIWREYIKNRILLELDDGPLSVKEVAEKTGFSPREVLASTAAMERLGLVSMVGVDGHSPRYVRS
ncbi:MAG: hydrogenase iron-sulfur subunit [Nitrososphaeria archaeon]|nr:hydrogenase iron-sulfur subunit [Nitrososphaeria archaeon]